MAKDSGIEWTHHTFNPWWGCVKLSPACAHCYAETWARRVGMELGAGMHHADSSASTHGVNPLDGTLRLNTSVRALACSVPQWQTSLNRGLDLDPWREKLWDLIEKTPHLDSAPADQAAGAYQERLPVGSHAARKRLARNYC